MADESKANSKTTKIIRDITFDATLGRLTIVFGTLAFNDDGTYRTVSPRDKPLVIEIEGKIVQD
jgi:hypothetical protein